MKTITEILLQALADYKAEYGPILKDTDTESRSHLTSLIESESGNRESLSNSTDFSEELPQSANHSSNLDEKGGAECDRSDSDQ